MDAGRGRFVPGWTHGDECAASGFARLEDKALRGGLKTFGFQA
jgi:hypothetical protein